VRHEFSKKTKLEAFTRCEGKCEGCGSLLRPGRFDYDHDLPAAFAGDNSISNCRVLCDGCHGKKTGERDIPAIAKSNRIRRRWAGIRPKSKFQTSRDGKYKAKIGGGIVVRK
jgi:5-methylcytosine-specific restriction protein A